MAEEKNLTPTKVGNKGVVTIQTLNMISQKVI